MNNLGISRRLQIIAEEVQQVKTVVDIGSDHALLPCFLCSRGQAAFAIAGEIAEGPFRAAQSQVRQQKLVHKISVRKGDGLEVIEPYEADVVVIAGMGGKLIADILEHGKEKLAGVSRLVLQPNVAEEAVRLWLLDHDWELKNEKILEEAEKIYEILIAEPGNGSAPYDAIGRTGLRFGPYLMKDKNPVFQKKWRTEIEKWKWIDTQLTQAANTEETLRRKQFLRKRIEETEAMLNGEDG